MKIHLTAIAIFISSMVASQNLDYYLLKTYHMSSQEQVEKISDYLEKAYVPALHELGFMHVGVFEWLGNDTSDHKKIFVLVPSKNAYSFMGIEDALSTNESHLYAGNDYWNTAHNMPAYDRVESSLLRAFSLHPAYKLPSLDGDKSTNVYELRSYESASEKLYRKKVEMFNEGGEIEIFSDLDFNAVFYAEALVGAETPNLVYMTSFDNMEQRDAHWDSFRSAPAWKVLSGKSEYKNTVSKIHLYLLRAAACSDF